MAEINNEPAYREIEFSLTNQQNYTSFVALANIPSFSFTLPVNNVFFGQEVNLGASVSYDTGDELTYTIQSDIDGQLLNHTTTETYLDTTRQLSYGRHELTYTIRDREGRIDTRTQIIDVVAGSDSFLVSINSLLDGETIPRNTDFTLGLDVVSPELGSICPSQGLNQNVLISWESSADGTIGEANTCESIASLSSLGVHTLTAKVNIGGQLVEKSVTVNVVESTLSATITSPTSGTSQGSSDVWNFTGIGTALSTVPLSNDSLTWYSNQDGYLGAGPSITAFLSAGTHEITLRVKNTLGEANTDKITVACNDDNAIPQMSILHPINNFGFEGGTDFRSYIAGIDLATANIEWSSSIDGVLGTAPNLPMTMLSPGAHTITLKVEGDFASIPLSQSVGINISRPVPEVAISMSDANTGTLLGATISETQDIQLTAIPQNGANLADATYEWRLRYYGSLSSVATLLGNGVSITSGNLSPGNYELLLIATTPENRKDTVSRDVLVMNEQTIIINTFNDGNSSNRSYTGPATYTPSLTVPADVTVLEASATFTTGTISTSGFVFKANGQTKISISGELASNTTYSVSFSVSSLQVPGSSTVIPFEITVGSGMIDGNIYVGYAAGINGSEDVTLPIINNLQVSPHPVVENNSTIVSATITDNAGLSSIYYKEENSGFNLINLNGETSYTLSETLTPAGLGKRALTVIATDVNGLSSVEEIPVSVVKNGTDIDIIGDDSFTFFVEEQSQTTVRKVRNIGNTMVANLPVAFYVNNQEVERESVSLLPGEEITLSFDWTPLVSGPITTKVMVDPENQLSELDETNNYSENILSVIDAIPPTITDLQYPEFVALSDSFNIRVVANDNASGDMFKLEGDYLGVSKDKTGLNQMFYELDFVVGNTGTNPVLLAISDFAGRKTVSVAEITTVAPNADLQITSFDYGTDIIAFTGLETRPLYVTISNNGSNGEDAGEFDVVFYQNGVEQDRVTVEELPVGDSRELDFEWQIALGEQFLEVIVDPLDNIQEMNENNNTASFRTLIEDDLPIIQNANITGQPVYIGGNFQIQATISDLVGLDEVLVAYQGIEQTMNLLDDSTGLYEANLTADTIGRQYVEIITTDTRGQVSKQKVYLTVYDVSVDLQVDHNNGIVAEYGDDLVAALSIRVGNFGGTAANNVLVSVLHNGVEIGNSTIDLAKGSIEELSFSANFVEGNNNIEVVLDPDSIIDESNEANNSSIRTFYVNDTFAPETPLLSISPDGWSTSSLFSVSWPADADPSVSYAYRLGSGDYVNVGNTTTVSIDVEEEGVHFLDVIAIDSLGNQSVPADTVLLYDAAEPNAPILTEMACGEEWTNLCDSAFIVWNIPELLSDPMGVATYRIVVDGISQQVEGNVNTMWLNQLGEGMHSIYVVAIDELGRESAPSNLVNIKVDRSGPAELLVTSSTHPSETEWYNSNSPVAMSWTPTVTDLSGIHQYFYVFNTEEDFNFIPEALTPAPASETSVDLTTTYIVDSLLTPIPEGEYYFHIVASDSAGNIGIPNKYRFGIDLTWPMTSIHYQGIEASDGLTITTGIPLQIVADDYLSGVQDSYYSVNGGMYLSGSQITLAQPGSYAITYYSVDSAGNQEPVDTINVTVSEALPCIGNILFITDINNNTGLPSSGGDRDLKEIIENTGLNVILIDDQSFTLADAQDKDLVFISSNTYSGYLTDDDLANLPIPIVNTEFVLFDDLGLSDGSHDHVSGKTVSVTNENHPITDGLPADVFVYNNVGPLAFNVPSNPDHVILSVPGHPEKGVITAFEVGDSLENGTVAPARRVTLFARNLVEGNLTEDGERIIGNAVIWAMNSCIPSPTTTSVISGNVCSTSGEIVYVMDNGNPNQGDTELINRITNLGHSVTVIDDDVFDYTDAAGKELVVISSSVISSKLADEHLHTMNVPVIVWESYSFDDLKLSDQYGNIENQDKIAISSGNHPIISGLAHGQPITVYNNEADMAYIETQSIPSENVLATVQGMPEKAVITAFDAGDTLSDGSVALARRVSLFNRDYKAGKLTTYGAVIFDNAISWAMSDCSENNTRIAQPVSENSPIKTNAYPNPFSNSVNVSFSLEKDATISIKLYDITGKQVNELLPSQKEVEGKHNYSFEMGGLRNGVYILTIECDNEVFYIEKLIKG
ncbi:MAG: CARDB domain-containing protein [Flammeovirgaceae bacterium]